MPRDYEVYLEDIRDAIDKVKRYTTGLANPFQRPRKRVERLQRIGTKASDSQPMDSEEAVKLLRFRGKSHRSSASPFRRERSRQMAKT
jgi:hypothetical protein